MRSLRCAWIWKRWRSDKRSMAPLSISFDHNTCTRHVEYHLVHDARTHTLNFLPYICDGRKLSTLKCGSSFGTDCSWECKSRDPNVTCVASSSWATDSMFNWTVTLTMMKGYEQQIAMWISKVTFSSCFRMAFFSNFYSL